MRKFLAALSLIFVGAACAFAAGCTNKNTVSISFDVNGGIEIADVTKKSGEEYTLPVPERDGYEFEGWYLSVDFSGDPVETVSATENTTYYAKWAQLYTISLELNGGSLAQTSLQLKAGADVYAFMADYVPTKSGLVFGAWFNGESELKKNTRMPANGITLSAKYKVAYSIEVYKQNMAGTEYVKDEEVISGADYVGTEISPEQSFTGFRQVDNDQSLTSKTLSATASENVLKFYFDREEYTVNFISNYPDGSANASTSVKVKYGNEVELPIDFTFEGYCLVGYSTTQSDNVEYGVNYVDTVLYNKKGENTEKATYSPDRNTSLYAVWKKGYTDMFGGNDYIFLLDENADVIYLARGNVFFEGEYRPFTKGFTIETKSDPISGRLNADGTFVYSTPSRTNKTYNQYKSSNIIRDVTVKLSAFNELYYTIIKDGNPVTSSGSYEIKDGLFYVHYNTGELAGEDAIMLLGTLQSGADVFMLREEEDVAMGVIPRIGITPDGSVGVYSNGLLGITLNGFGVATINMGEQSSSFNYTFNDDRTEITLSTGFGINDYVARLMELDGYEGYMFYNKSLDLEIEQSGGSLTLDGICRATYVKGDTVLNGYYVSWGSYPMGGTMVRIYAGGETYNVLINSSTESITNEDGSTTKVTTYSFVEKLPTYAEYYYYDHGTQAVYTHIIALDDTAVGKASVYQRVSQTEYAKVAVGSYVYKEGSGIYEFKKEEYFNVEGVSKNPVDMSTVTAFSFYTGEYSSTNSFNMTTTYDVIYWLTTTTEEETTDNTTVYTGADGAKLTLIGEFAILKTKDELVNGTYSINNDILGISASTVRYLRINEEEKTFVLLESAPVTAYELLPNGNYLRTNYIYFDGTAKGAVYTYVDGEETVTLEGTFERTDETTEFGYFVFEFKSGDVKFKFIRTASSSRNLFAKYDAEHHGEYVSEKDGVLSLDGYSCMASYMSTNGYRYEGYYTVISESTIRLDLNSTYSLYFDLDGKTFTLRGTEYGNYLVMNNRSSDGLFFEFDGYGNAKVYTPKTENNETVREYIDENATYSVADRLYTVKYTDNGVKKSVVGRLMVYTTGSGNFTAFVIIHDEVVQTYVNEKDYSTLILDNAGGAVKYDARGVREDGSYTLITDTILSYVNNKGTDAYIYVYDTEKATATTVSFTPWTYFADSLEALEFTRFGIAIFNGSTRAYYSVDELGNVTIYRLPEENEAANAYGFVEEDFGKFDNEKQYGGYTYYKNSGYDLSFARGEEGDGVNNYPVPFEKSYENKTVVLSLPLKALKFIPSGTYEFSVAGTVVIDDGDSKTNDEYPCTVVRRIKDGETETFITISLGLAYFRFDVELTYGGENKIGQSNCSYVITAMYRILDIPAYNYLYTQYMYSMFDSMLGTNMASSITNTLGTISIKYDYDVEGKIIGAVYDPETGELAYVKDEEGNDTDEYVNDGGYLTAEFGESSGIFDANGNLIRIDHAEFTNDGSNYTVNITGEDGYDYCLRFTRVVFQQMRMYGYRLIFTRVQKFTYGEYTVEVERTIGSDYSNLYRGGIFSLKLTKGETEIEMTSGIIKADGSVEYINRTFGEGDDKNKIISSTYYTIAFKEVVSEVVGDEEGRIVPVFESVTITEEAVTTVYSEDGASYVDMAGSDIRLIYVNGRSYLVTECEYDSETGKYTVTTYGSTYTVEIKDGKADITEVQEEEDSQETV